ncbi:MAG TPA: hypothetical protein VGK56_01285 [Anaerolineales bacterium]
MTPLPPTRINMHPLFTVDSNRIDGTIPNFSIGSVWFYFEGNENLIAVMSIHGSYMYEDIDRMTAIKIEKDIARAAKPEMVDRERLHLMALRMVHKVAIAQLDEELGIT